MVTIGVVGAVLAAGSVISPALGGPSLKKLVRKEVTKQLAGKQGPQGPAGQPGNQGPAGLNPGQTLPAGVTLRGVFNASSGGVDVGNGVSFGGGAYSLPARPVPHVIDIGDPSSTDCPGTGAAPDAAPGQLCIYLVSAFNPLVIVTDPTTLNNGISYNRTTDVTTTIGDGKVSPLGFRIAVSDAAAGVRYLEGSWAAAS